MPFRSKNVKNDRDDDTPSLDNSLNSIQQNEHSFFDEENSGIPIPKLASPFYGLINQIAFFGFSQRGESHIKSETSCQDRCYSFTIPDKGIIIAAVADGVGSCALSDLGADIAVHTSVESISNELQSCKYECLDSIIAGSLLRNAFQIAYDQVEQTAKKYEQLVYSLQSTLTVAIYDGSDLYFGHAGDDGIVALTERGTLALATTRHKGEEASSVYPLQAKTTWQFGMVPNTVAFTMATDGVLDAFVRSSFENDRVYYPFLEPIFTAEYSSPKDVKQVCSDLYSYMKSKKYRSVVTDDLSIVAVMNLDKIPQCLPQFDLDAWNEETKGYEEKVRTALYDQTQVLPHESREKKYQHPPKEGSAFRKDVPKSNQVVSPPQDVWEAGFSEPASGSPLREDKTCLDERRNFKPYNRNTSSISYGSYRYKNDPDNSSLKNYSEINWANDDPFENNRRKEQSSVDERHTNKRNNRNNSNSSIDSYRYKYGPDNSSLKNYSEFYRANDNPFENNEDNDPDSSENNADETEPGGNKKNSRKRARFGRIRSLWENCPTERKQGIIVIFILAVLCFLVIKLVLNMLMPWRLF